MGGVDPPHVPSTDWGVQNEPVPREKALMFHYVTRDAVLDIIQQKWPVTVEFDVLADTYNVTIHLGVNDEDYGRMSDYLVNFQSLTQEQRRGL